MQMNDPAGCPLSSTATSAVYSFLLFHNAQRGRGEFVGIDCPRIPRHTFFRSQSRTLASRRAPVFFQLPAQVAIADHAEQLQRRQARWSCPASCDSSRRSRQPSSCLRDARHRLPGVHKLMHPRQLLSQLPAGMQVSEIRFFESLFRQRDSECITQRQHCSSGSSRRQAHRASFFRDRAIQRDIRRLRKS